MSSPVPDPSLSRIVELEAELAGFLRDRRFAAIDRRWIGVADRWSELVWARAERVGPPSLSRDEVRRGLALIERPVFVCGAHRSGTTMLRDLLDGHPQLVVLPSEGTWYTNLERRLAGRLPRDRCGAMAREWLRRVVNPNNQAPFWLLGQSNKDSSPYVEFARRHLGWWQVLEKVSPHQRSQWPLAAIVLAYRDLTSGENLGGAIAWVEKTPTNERYLELLWGEFPRARVLQVVRPPLDALASYKAISPHAWGLNAHSARMVRNLITSHRIAARQTKRADPRYLRVAYADLTDRPEPTAVRLARFVGIEYSRVLTLPTVAKLPASRNSSFADGDRTHIGLGFMERACIHFGTLVK